MVGGWKLVECCSSNHILSNIGAVEKELYWECGRRLKGAVDDRIDLLLSKFKKERG